MKHLFFINTSTILWRQLLVTCDHSIHYLINISISRFLETLFSCSTNNTKNISYLIPHMIQNHAVSI